MSTELIALTGGIGSGKTVVSRVLAAMGYPVYDCDSRAKAIMDADTAIHHRIVTEIDTESVKKGIIDRKRLSEAVFSNPAKLSTLNAIVHGAVRDDITRWKNTLASRIAFVETAILYESGLDRMVESVWEVSAPEELRIERVKKRSGLTETDIRARIRVQASSLISNPHPKVAQLINDGLHPLLPQIEKLAHLLK